MTVRLPPIAATPTTEESIPTLLTGTVLRAGGGQYEVDVRADGLAGHNLDESNNKRSGTNGKDGAGSRVRAGVGNAASDDGASIADEGSADASISDDTVLLCSVRGILKHSRQRASQPVSVGDRVRVRPFDSWGPDARGRRLREGTIEAVLPRRSVLARSRFNKTDQITVANLDQAVIVMSLREPELNTHRLDRFLVLAEASDLHAVICLNKCDLLKKRELKSETAPLLKLYNGLGYTTLLVSAETDAGIDELRAALREHISAFVGSSGVGKSSLINAIQPGLRLWVGDVMEIGKGRHTTTEVSLHPLTGGGYLADTPGVKTVALLEREDVDVAQCFPEFRPLLGGCRFNNCSHTREPGCAIRAGAEGGDIAPARYDSYIKMQNDVTPTRRTGSGVSKSK